MGGIQSEVLKGRWERRSLCQGWACISEESIVAEKKKAWGGPFVVGGWRGILMEGGGKGEG